MCSETSDLLYLSRNSQYFFVDICSETSRCLSRDKCIVDIYPETSRLYIFIVKQDFIYLPRNQWIAVFVQKQVDCRYQSRNKQIADIFLETRRLHMFFKKKVGCRYQFRNKLVLLSKLICLWTCSMCCDDDLIPSFQHVAQAADLVTN